MNFYGSSPHQFIRVEYYTKSALLSSMFSNKLMLNRYRSEKDYVKCLQNACQNMCFEWVFNSIFACFMAK